MRSESEAIALVRDLPEVRDILTRTVRIDRFEEPYLRAVAVPEFGSPSQNAKLWWEIAVADRQQLDAGNVDDGGAAMSVRVDAYGAVSIRSLGDLEFRDYAAWRALQEARALSAELVMVLPEWKQRAALTARFPGHTLGLGCAEQLTPPGCIPGQGECRLRCEAIRLCTESCGGGHWATFEVDPAKKSIFVTDATTIEVLPYGQWRSRFRAKARQSGEPEFRLLTAPQQSFPDNQPGNGDFGYGAPTRVSTVVRARMRDVFSRGHYELLRQETYGKAGFALFVLEPAEGARSTTDGEAFRRWGADLVRANGLRACEIVIQPASGPTQRYQFDRFALDPGDSGVYVFVDGAFQPWLKG